MTLLRGVFCWMMIVLVPGSLLAADPAAPGAIVRPYGAAWLNGVTVEQPSAIFSGDLLQTTSGSALKIRSSGSSVTVLSDSLVEFEGGAVSVQHGSVKLVTSKSMSARAGIVTATPASRAWTEFELSDVGGTVQILAVKGDLQISDGSQTTTLPQGQQATQKDSDDTQSTQAQTGPVPPLKKKKKKAGIILLSAGAATAGGLAWGLEAANAGSPRHISPITP